MSLISQVSTKKGKRNHFLKQLELKLALHYQDGKISGKAYIENFYFEKLEFHHFAS